MIPNARRPSEEQSRRSTFLLSITGTSLRGFQGETTTREGDNLTVSEQFWWIEAAVESVVMIDLLI